MKFSTTKNSSERSALKIFSSLLKCVCVGSDRSPYFARNQLMWKRRKSSLPWELLHECTQRFGLKVPEKQYEDEHSRHNTTSFTSITQLAQFPSLQQLQPEVSVGVLQGPLAAGTWYVPFPCGKCKAISASSSPGSWASLAVFLVSISPWMVGRYLLILDQTVYF